MNTKYKIDKEPVNAPTFYVSLVARAILGMIGIWLIATGLSASFTSTLFVVIGIALLRSGMVLTFSDKR